MHFHPEVYPPTPNQVTGTIFEDRNANGVRDHGEPEAPADEIWKLAVVDPDWVQVYEVEQGGGEFTLPADPGLTDGEAVLIVTAKPSDWIATTATTVALTLPGAGPVDLGFYKLGSITGVVTETGREQGLQEPAEHATVFVDLNENGEFDTGEPTATTKEDGSYELESLHPGVYQLFVVPPAGTGCAVVSPRPAVVEIASGQRVDGVGFTIAVNQPPVIEEVLLGSITNVPSWQSVPDGQDQLVPIDLADQVTHIALEVCSTGLGASRGNGLLYQLDAGGNTLEELPLEYAQTAGNRVIYAVGSVSQPVSLPAGRYVIELADTAIVDVTGRKLDGEWAGSPTGDPAGVYFPTGNSTAGGEFLFEFRIGGAAAKMMAATSTATSGAVATSSTIQGSIWWHDDTPGAAVGRAPNEQGLAGQKVRLVGQTSGITRTATTADVDLNSDGFISFNETGVFQFSNLPPDTYVVSQEPTEPWVQKTPGAGTLPAELLAVTHETATAKSSFWKVDPAGPAATFMRDVTGVFAAWDVAAVGHGVVYVTGESLSPTGVTPQFDGGLWQVNLDTGAVIDLGAAPTGEIIVSLDTLNADNLLGLTANGKLLSYNLITGAWANHGGVFDQVDGTRYYPVGDLAVVSPREIYAILDVEQPNPNGVSAFQSLGRIDLTVGGPNTVKLQEYRGLTSRLIGLEVDQQGMLVAFTEKHEFFELPTGGPPTLKGSIAGMNATNTGGFAILPTQLEPDNTTLDFTIEIGAGETVDIGFGNKPDYELLKDGDDTIDGGCGEQPDELHGDDVARDGSAPANLELDWWVLTEGGNDRIRGRGGNDFISGGQQGDYLYGDDGTDEIIGGDAERNRIEGGAGDDDITGGADRDVALGQDGNDTISTPGGNDSLFGGDHDDTLSGGDHDDTLIGGPGNDTVSGDAGDDLLVVIDTSLSLAGNFATPAGPGVTDSYDGGSGFDTLALVDDVDVTLTDTDLTAHNGTHAVASIEFAYLVGGVSNNTIDAVGFSGDTEIHGKAGADTLLGGSGQDEIHGDAGDDTIEGNAGNDDLFGGTNSDTISGGGDDDLIVGGSGTNTLAGDAGNDTFLFTDNGASDRLSDSLGTDVADFSTFSSSLTLAVGDAAEPAPVVVFRQHGSFRTELMNDTIETILLGTGDDTLLIKEGGSTIAAVDARGGTDLVSYRGGYSSWTAWTANAAVDLGAGTATGFGAVLNAENAHGGDGDDTLTGSAADNRLYGYGGNDTIAGLAGNDTLWGFAGDDSISGGADDDSIDGGAGTNTLAGGTGNDDYVFFDNAQTDTVNENLGEGDDRLDFAYVTGDAVTVTLNGSIHAEVNGSTVTAAAMNAIETIRGGSHADRFVVADGTVFTGLLDGGSVQGAGYDDMNILDLSGWTTPVSVDYTGQTTAVTIESASVAAGGVVWLQHVIGGSAGDTFVGGDQPVWFEGRGGDDSLTGSSQGDRIAGGTGNDTLSGGFGDDGFIFADLFGTDTVNEAASAGSDTMDFSAVTVPLEVLLGSVTVSDGSSTATHAGDHIEAVIGGSADDDFVMTDPSVTFPGTLDGSGGNNTLWYDNPSAAVVASVEANGTPGVSPAINFAAVNAIEWQENASISGPVLLGTDYDGEVYVNPATPVTFAGIKVSTSVFGGRFELLEAEAIPVPSGGTQNVLFARDTTGGHLVRLPASATWAMVGLFGISPMSTPVLVKPGSTPAGSPLQLPVELNGAVNLRRDEVAKLAVDDGITLTALRKDGDAVTQTSKPGYRIVAAETVGGTNQLLLIAATGDGLIWSFDASWVWTGETTFIAGSADAKQAELDFELDLNLDGTIGS